MRGLGIGLGLTLNRGQWVGVADSTNFGGTLTGLTYTPANNQNRFGVANAAGTLLEDISNGLHVVNLPGVNLVSGVKYRATLYVRGLNGFRDCNFGFSGLGFGLNVDLVGQTIFSPYGALLSQLVAASTNSFTKVQFSFVCPTSGFNTVDIFVANPAGNLSYAGDISKGLVVDEYLVEAFSA